MALLVNPADPAQADTTTRDVQGAARALGLELHVLNASTERDFDVVFAKRILGHAWPANVFQSCCYRCCGAHRRGFLLLAGASAQSRR